MDSEQAYRQYLENQEKEFEAQCRRCGACCGAEEDPCEHLQVVSAASYTCDIYQQRFGAHRTKSGKEMRCVELRDMRHQEWPGGWKCGYLTKVESREGRGQRVLRDEGRPSRSCGTRTRDDITRLFVRLIAVNISYYQLKRVAKEASHKNYRLLDPDIWKEPLLTVINR